MDLTNARADRTGPAILGYGMANGKPTAQWCRLFKFKKQPNDNLIALACVIALLNYG